MALGRVAITVDRLCTSCFITSVSIDCAYEIKTSADAALPYRECLLLWVATWALALLTTLISEAGIGHLGDSPLFM